MPSATPVTAASGGQVTPVILASGGQASLIADVLALGRPIAIVVSGPATPVQYASGPAAFFSAVAAAGGSVSAPRQTLYTNLFNSLQSAGFLAMLNRLGIMAAENTQSALIDLINPSLSLTPVGAPTFTVDQGYVGGSAGKYIDTGQDPTAASLMSRDSNSFGVGTLSTRSVGADTVLIGNVQVSGCYGIWPLSTVPTVMPSNSDAPFFGQFALPNPNIKGVWQCIRASSATRVTCINGVQVQSVASVSAAPTTGKSILLGAWRNTDGVSVYANATDNVCLWFCGAPFTVPQSLAFANILNTYMTAIGSPLF